MSLKIATLLAASSVAGFLLLLSCGSGERTHGASSGKSIIFDTDANNELDDQHALAYLLFNDSTFNIKAITVNATYNGGNIEGHYLEAKRVMQLCGWWGKTPLLKGANASFAAIRNNVAKPGFDGQEAVDFIIEQAKKEKGNLIVLAVGKLTNVALAVEKAPEISKLIRVVWLGSNYPLPGEYNQDNDTVSMNYLLNKEVPFEMVTVRYGKPSGTSAVTATKAEIQARMPGLGPLASNPVEGRHGGTFTRFGDYSVNLFEHIDYHDSTMSRALFDMVAVAILKNPSWGEKKDIPAPVLIDRKWQERPSNPRKIVLWENFDKGSIMTDFYATMKRK